MLLPRIGRRLCEMPREIRIVIFGLGPLGAAIAKGVLGKKGMKIVGAVDIAQSLVGRDLGDVLQIGRSLGVKVTDDAERMLSKSKPDIAVIATRSSVKAIQPQLTLCAKKGVDVISTCEELSYPYNKYPALSRQIAGIAKKYGVTILGTGINPGYLMDALPITLTGPCLRVDRIKVTRMMDSSKRRIPFQKKIGTGLTPEEFRKLIDDKVITGHVGLAESIGMIAGALGWKLDEIRESPPEPFIAEKEIVTSYTTIKPGCATGLKSTAVGIKDAKPVIELEFYAHADVEEEYDAVSIEGQPNINQKVIGGVHGDTGTVAVMLNMIPKVMNSEPGLVTMKDLPPPSVLNEDARMYVHKKR